MPHRKATPRHRAPSGAASHLPSRVVVELSAAFLLIGTAVAVGRPPASAGPSTADAASLELPELPAPAAAQVQIEPPAAPLSAVPEPAAAPEPAEPEVESVEAPSAPRRISVKRLKIETPLINLGLLQNGELEVPQAFDIAGWHSNGTAPGDIGPAVIVGHVDSNEGPAIFYRVRELVPGDKIVVDRVNGSQVVFEVYGKETVAKDKFPTEKVYGDTGSPELRLLTCGGRYNKKTKSYTDNVLVFARQVTEPVPA